MSGEIKKKFFHAEVECVRYYVDWLPPKITYVSIGRRLSGEKWEITLPNINFDAKAAEVALSLKVPFGVVPFTIHLSPFIDARIVFVPALYSITKLPANIKLNTALKLMGDKTTTYGEYYRVYNIRDTKTLINGLVGIFKASRYKSCEQFDDQVLKSSVYLNRLSEEGGGSGSCEDVYKVVSQDSGIYLDAKGSLDFTKSFGFVMGVHLLFGKKGGFFDFWVGGNLSLGAGVFAKSGGEGEIKGSVTMEGLKLDKIAASASARAGLNISLFGGVVLFLNTLGEVLAKKYYSYLIYDIFTRAGGVENGKELDSRGLKEWVIEQNKKGIEGVLTDDKVVLEVLK